MDGVCWGGGGVDDGVLLRSCCLGTGEGFDFVNIGCLFVACFDARGDGWNDKNNNH